MTWNHFIACALVAAASICTSSSSSSSQGGAVRTSEPRVLVESGELVGTVIRSIISGRPLYTFLGVPYASPPILENRFKEPQPVKQWSGVWNATILGSNCIGMDHGSFQIHGEEDCLYLNVYTPKLPKKESTSGRPMNVIMFIHGGAFQFGEGAWFGPHYLLDGNDADVVYVSVNYRLGPMGFASTGDEIVPGNNGLKDQTAALKWIQRNIAAFGGDPGAVTVAGMSAGGASVHYHLLSPLSSGLFTRGIAESGSAFCHWAYSENVVQKTKQLADFLGCPTRSSEEIVKCLRSRPAKIIVESLKNFMPWKYNPFTIFGPTVEKAGSGRFLTDLPENLPAQDVPILFSYTKDDGLYPAAEFVTREDVMLEMEAKWEKILPFVLDYNYTVSHESLKPEIARKIKTFYFGNNSVSLKTRQSIVDMTSDRMFIEPVARAAKHLASKSTSPVYLYEFDYRGKYSLSDVFSKDGNSQGLGVAHGDDTMYILKTAFGNPHDNVQDAKLIPAMVKMWLSFVKTGTPDIASSAGVWTPVSRNPADPLRLVKITQNQTFQPQEQSDPGNHTFWSSLPLTEFWATNSL